MLSSALVAADLGPALTAGVIAVAGTVLGAAVGGAFGWLAARAAASATTASAEVSARASEADRREAALASWSEQAAQSLSLAYDSVWFATSESMAEDFMHAELPPEEAQRWRTTVRSAVVALRASALRAADSEARDRFVDLARHLQDGIVLYAQVEDLPDPNEKHSDVLADHASDLMIRLAEWPGEGLQLLDGALKSAWSSAKI